MPERGLFLRHHRNRRVYLNDDLGLTWMSVEPGGTLRRYGECRTSQMPCDDRGRIVISNPERMDTPYNQRTPTPDRDIVEPGHPLNHRLVPYSTGINWLIDYNGEEFLLLHINCNGIYLYDSLPRDMGLQLDDYWRIKLDE